jgi:hypothetical protein
MDEISLQQLYKIINEMVSQYTISYWSKIFTTEPHVLELALLYLGNNDKRVVKAAIQVLDNGKLKFTIFDDEKKAYLIPFYGKETAIDIFKQLLGI